jgi:hypothetical protein
MPNADITPDELADIAAKLVSAANIALELRQRMLDRKAAKIELTYKAIRNGADNADMWARTNKSKCEYAIDRAGTGGTAAAAVMHDALEADQSVPKKRR